MAEHKPFIPASAKLRELSIGPLVTGTVLGIIFGASSLYLVRKVGLTVSASIQVAVISITFYRVLQKLGFRGSTILEDNIVQTAGSAGESIAFGVGVTMPAIMILGFDLEISRVMLVAILGGLLGILMMIPLRRALIVENHDTLKYPEGTACAEVLKAGASKESIEASGEMGAAAAQTLSARAIFVGFFLGLAYKTAMAAFKAWKDTPERIFDRPLPSASLSAEISPELLGVGYIIGPRVASVMCAGGVLAYLVLIPMIKMFGSASGAIAPGHDPISGMGPDEIRSSYVLYIGAGAVAAGGMVSLVQAMPTIGKSLRKAFGDIFKKRDKTVSTLRTDLDLSPKVVLIGSLALIAVISLAAPLHMNALGAVLIVLLGFLFVTVSSRLTGELGSSSNPISGMTVATLLLTCLVFLLVGWTGPHYYVTALSVGAIVCIAASNGGTTSQDLKTGYLLGSTPRSQQIAILVGALASAIALGPILLRLNDTATVYVSETQIEGGIEVHTFDPDLATDPSVLHDRETLHGPQADGDHRAYLVWQKLDDDKGPPGKYFVDDQGHAKYLVDPGINGTHSVRPDGTKVTKFAAPKATLMSYIIKGILNQKLPWGLVLLGVMIAAVLEMSGVPSLAFAVGLYLPLSSSTPILAGGIARLLVDRYTRKKHEAKKLSEAELTAEGDKSPGVLLASGYIAGGAIAGIVIAFMAGAMEKTTAAVETWSRAHNPFFDGAYSDALSMIPFVLLTVALVLVGRESLLAGKKSR
ncbi:hypothetical protein BH09MYX1_BH09MYX1_11950 [soil metagenome]